jgi:hypothetical protein
LRPAACTRTSTSSPAGTGFAFHQERRRRAEQKPEDMSIQEAMEAAGVDPSEMETPEVAS